MGGIRQLFASARVKNPRHDCCQQCCIHRSLPESAWGRNHDFGGIECEVDHTRMCRMVMDDESPHRLRDPITGTPGCCARAERPRCRRAAECHDKVAPSHATLLRELTQFAFSAQSGLRAHITRWRCRRQRERRDHKAEVDPRPISLGSPGKHEKMDHNPQTHGKP